MNKYIELFKDREGVCAFFTTKYGAVRGAPEGTVFNNTEVFFQLGIEDSLKVWPKQIHKTGVEIIRKDDVEAWQSGAESGLLTGTDQKGILLPETDGVITDVPNILLTSVHADCLPVYLYDEKNRIIGLVHAGWRGTLAGIVAQTVRKMTNILGVSPDALRVCVGPGISKCCFEVGEEVTREFLLEWGNSFADEKNADSLSRGENNPAERKYMLDLKAAVKHQLLLMGIKEEHVAISEHCTCCEPELICAWVQESVCVKGS